MRKRTESTLITETLKFLQCHENLGNIFYCDRLNSGAAYVGDGIKKRRIRLCRPGTPDLFFIANDGTVCWVETKSENGRLSAEQIEFKKRLSMVNNHFYFVIRSVDELIKQFDIFK